MRPVRRRDAIPGIRQTLLDGCMDEPTRYLPVTNQQIGNGIVLALVRGLRNRRGCGMLPHRGVSYLPVTLSLDP